MIYFLVALAALLAAATVWFLVRPAGRGAQIDAREQYHQLLGVRERLLAQLNELDIDAGDRSMEADTAADERARLEGELADVLKKIDAAAPQASKTDDEATRFSRAWRGAVIGLALIVPLVAGGLYFINASVAPTRLAALAATPAGVPPQALKMVERLEQRLQQNPDDVEGWLRLGRSYVVMQRMEDARLAYEHAYRLLPKNYEPQNGEAQWFLGLAAYNTGDTRRALDYWQKLLATIPPDTEAAKNLKSVIEQARQRAGAQGKK